MTNHILTGEGDERVAEDAPERGIDWRRERGGCGRISEEGADVGELRDEGGEQ